MKEHLQTAAQNPCDALTMTKTLLVGDRKSGCKMKNDGMQMSYFAINYAIYILAKKINMDRVHQNKVISGHKTPTQFKNSVQVVTHE